MKLYLYQTLYLTVISRYEYKGKQLGFKLDIDIILPYLKLTWKSIMILKQKYIYIKFYI
jgi:hypothetical protein